ncbi:MAG: hypothetical protein ACYTF1_16090 [Planctomycetota bacterium]|jgi:hypothetical protein
MKKRYYIRFNVPREDDDRFRCLLDAIGCGDYWQKPQEPWTERGRPHLAEFFDEDDPKLASLLGLLRKEGVDWYERIEHIYTTEELRVAPLLEFNLSSKQRDVGNQKKEIFDFSKGCPHCGTGAEQIGPLAVMTDELPKEEMICQTLHHHYLVTEPLKQALDIAELSGLELRQVVSQKQRPLAWWQIISYCEFPPMAPETRGIKHGKSRRKCMQCMRDGWVHTGKEPPSVFYYKDDLTFDILPDVACTYERFGI